MRVRYIVKKRRLGKLVGKHIRPRNSIEPGKYLEN